MSLNYACRLSIDNKQLLFKLQNLHTLRSSKRVASDLRPLRRKRIRGRPSRTKVKANNVGGGTNGHFARVLCCDGRVNLHHVGSLPELGEEPQLQ
jgi:hypothetical protein